MMASKFAIVTGASTGIGLELAKLAAQDGYDLLVVADTPFVDASAGAEPDGLLSKGPRFERNTDPRCISVKITASGPGSNPVFRQARPLHCRH